MNKITSNSDSFDKPVIPLIPVPKQDDLQKYSKVFDVFRASGHLFGYQMLAEAAGSAYRLSSFLYAWKAIESGVLNQRLNSNILSEANPSQRVSFWKALQVNCMMAKRCFENASISKTPTEYGKICSSWIGFLGVMGNARSIVEHAMWEVGSMKSADMFLAAMGEMERRETLPAHRRISNVADIVISTAYFAKSLMASSSTSSLLVLGFISSLAGLIKIYMNETIDSLEQMKQTIIDTLQKEMAVSKQHVEERLNQKGVLPGDARYDIFDRGNFKNNVDKIRTAQDPLELYGALHACVEDLLYYEDAFLGKDDETFTPTQVEAFLQLQTNCEELLLRSIDQKELDLKTLIRLLDMYRNEGGGRGQEVILQINDNAQRMVDAIDDRLPRITIDPKQEILLEVENKKPVPLRAWFEAVNTFFNEATIALSNEPLL